MYKFRLSGTWWQQVPCTRYQVPGYHLMEKWRWYQVPEPPKEQADTVPGTSTTFGEVGRLYVQRTYNKNQEYTP